MKLSCMTETSFSGSFICICLFCPSAAGKSTFVRLLQGESEDWEVIPEPIGKWCNVQNDSEDVYQVSKQQLNATRDNDKHCSVCLPAGRLSFCARVCLQDLSSSQKSGGNLLQMLYDKPSRWSYTFQVTAPDSAHSPR